MYLDHIFAAQGLGQLQQFLGNIIAVKDHLHNACAIAQPDKHDAAQVACPLHPSLENHGLSRHLGGYLTAHMGAIIHGTFLL